MTQENKKTQEEQEKKVPPVDESEEVILDENKPMFQIGWVKGEQNQLGFKKIGNAKADMFQIAAMLTHIQARNTLNVFETVKAMDDAVAQHMSIKKKQSKEGMAGWRKRPKKTKKQMGRNQ